MATDLDYFPLFEALRDTPVSVHLHCFTSRTSDELMSLADVGVPITPFTVLRWFGVADRDKFVQRIPLGHIPPILKEGVYAGQPFYIYQEPPSGDCFGRSMATDPNTFMRAQKCEFIVWQFEDNRREPVYFDDPKNATDCQASPHPSRVFPVLILIPGPVAMVAGWPISAHIWQGEERYLKWADRRLLHFTWWR